MELIDLAIYRKTSFRDRIRQFYLRLDETSLDYGSGVKDRQIFVLRARGEFLSILRLQRQIEEQEIARYLKLTVEELRQVEVGDRRLKDGDFFNAAAYLGGANEISVFFEKMEKALTPGLREARKKFSRFSWIYGITFADESRDEAPE